MAGLKNLWPGFKRQSRTMMFQFTFWQFIILIFIVALIGLSVLASTAFVSLYSQHKELKAVENELMSESKSIKNSEQLQDVIQEVLEGHPNYYAEITDGRGTVIAHSKRSSYVFQKAQYVLDEHFFNAGWVDDRGPYLVDEQKSHGLTIHLAFKLVDLWQLLIVLFNVLWISGLACTVIGAVLIYLVAYRNFRPLKRITDSVNTMKIEDSSHQQIPVPDHPEELRRLAGTFNELLEKFNIKLENEKSFTSNASHELRTPLTAMRGHLNLIRRWGKKNPEILDESMEAIQAEGARMQRLIDQLLSLARNDHQQTKKQQLDLQRVIAEAIKPLADLAQEKNISLAFDSREDIKIKGNEDQIKQIVIILTENAIKYNSPGGSVTISSRLVEDTTILQVQDTGYGIPAEDLPYIFERFYRVDKARARKSGGTGLGLSIARTLAAQHHGLITVESSPGHGSTFTVQLPAYSDLRGYRSN